MTRPKRKKKHNGRAADQQRLADREAWDEFGVKRLANPQRCPECGTLNLRINRAARKCLPCMMRAMEAVK